jgi:putative transcriptional regulator
MDSLQGYLLLASEELADPNFARSIVLVIEHNEQGALGVVLNRPTSKTVCELWREVSQVASESRQAICLGGPVSGPVMALHTVPDLAELEIIAGVYFAAKKQHLDQLVQQAGSAAGAPTHAENPFEGSPSPSEALLPFKIFVGHAGWGPGQLEREIQQRAWYTLPARIEHVFDPDPGLWERLVQALDRVRLARLLKIKHIPPDPGLN